MQGAAHLGFHGPDRAPADLRDLLVGQVAILAQEKHFLKELSLKELVETLIVTQSSAGAADVQRQLQAAGVRGSFSLREGGFLSYLRDDDALEAFLA